MESVVDDVDVQENWLRQKEELKAWAAAQGGSTDLHKVFQWLSWSWLWWWWWSWSWSSWRRAICQNLGQGRNMMKIIKMMKSLFKESSNLPVPAYWIGHRCLDWLLSEQWSESVPCLDLLIRRNSLWRRLFTFDPPSISLSRIGNKSQMLETKKIERKSGLGQRCQYLKCQKKRRKKIESQVGGGGVTPVNAQLFGSLVQLCQTRYCQNISTFSVPQCRPAEYLFVENLLKDINFLNPLYILVKNAKLKKPSSQK